jgi:hypothetical protein
LEVTPHFPTINNTDIRLKFKKETSKVLSLEDRVFMMLKLGHFGKYIRNIWNVLERGAGEGWRRSVGPIV